MVGVSGLTGEGLDRLMQAVITIYGVWNKRVATAALNRWLEDTVAAHPPPAVSGRRLKLNYLTQPKGRPPSFVLFCTRADAVPDGYQAIPGQRPARGVRIARHADPAHLARKGQSVRRPGQSPANQLTNRGNGSAWRGARRYINRIMRRPGLARERAS